MSQNVEEKAHNGALFSNQKICDRCKNCQCQSKITPTKKILDEICDKIAQQYKSFLSSDRRQPLMNQIKEIDMLSPIDSQDPLSLLIAMEQHSQGQRYNTVRMMKYSKLSKQSRITLDKSFDALTGIKIACFNPQIDIQSVTLYAAITLPKQEEISKINSFDPIEYFTSETSPLYKLCYNKETCDVHYVPIRTIYHPHSNYIKFFNCPLLLCSENMVSFSIEVKFNNSLKIPPGQNIIGLDYLMFQQSVRMEAQQKHSLFGRHERFSSYIFNELNKNKNNLK